MGSCHGKKSGAEAEAVHMQKGVGEAVHMQAVGEAVHMQESLDHENPANKDAHQWIDELNREDADVRRGAVRKLLDEPAGYIREAGGIAPLVDLLMVEVARESAMDVLLRLASDPVNRAAIRQAGGIEPLVALLTDKPKGMRDKVVTILKNLALNNPPNQDAIREAEGVVPLVGLLSDEEIIQGEVVGALRNLVFGNSTNQDAVREADGIIPLVKLLNSEDRVLRQKVAIMLENLADNNEANKNAIREAGAIPLLVKLLGDRDTELRQHAAGVLSMLAYNAVNQEAIREAGGIPLLVGMLGDENTGLRQQAVGALRNLTSKNEANQASICESGGVASLVMVLADTSIEVRQEAVSALRNLIFNAANHDAIREANGVASLVGVLEDEDIELRWNAVDALESLINNDNPADKEAICRADGISSLVRLLSDDEVGVRQRAVGVLQNLVYGNLANQNAFRDIDGIAPLVGLLKDQDTMVRQKAAAVIRNLAFNNDANKDAIRAEGAIPPLVSLLKDSDPKVQQQVKGALDRLDYQPGEERRERKPVTKALDGGGRVSRENSVKTHDISFKDLTYSEEDHLGAGSFANVYKGLWQRTDVAIKMLKAQGIPAEAVAELRHEGEIMMSFRHPNIMCLYGVCMDPGHYGLVMQYMPRGSLYTLVNNPAEQLDWPKRLDIALGIVTGLQFLHDAKPTILHRDLKSLNIMLDARDLPVITDFGLSKVKTSTASLTKSLEKGVGTVPWMAPEMFEPPVKYTKACDIFSLGMILWELAARKQPWSEVSSAALIAVLVTQGKREDIPEKTPKLYGKLIKRCWEQRSTKRPTIAKVVKKLEDCQTAVAS